MYSISYVPTGGDFGEQDCAFWRSYGEPYRFDSYEQAAAYIRSIPYLRDLDGKVVSWRVAMQLTEEMVEVYSGRRKIVGYRRPIVNEAKADYAKVMKLLERREPRPRRFPVETKRVIQRVAGPCNSFVSDEAVEI